MDIRLFRCRCFVFLGLGLVNKYSGQGRVALETRHEAWTIEDAPSRATLKARHIIYAETRKWLSRSLGHRFWFNLDQLALHVPLLMTVAGMAWGGATSNVILLSVSAFAFVVGYVLHTVFGRMAMAAFDDGCRLKIYFGCERGQLAYRTRIDELFRF